MNEFWQILGVTSNPSDILKALLKLKKEDPQKFHRVINTPDVNDITPLGYAFFSSTLNSDYNDLKEFLLKHNARMTDRDISVMTTCEQQYQKDASKCTKTFLMDTVSTAKEELFTNAKLPDKIRVCEGLPFFAPEIKEQSRELFEKQHNITWCVSHIINRGMRSFKYFPNPNENNAAIRQYLEQPSDNFVVANLAPPLGNTTFAAKDLLENTVIIYPGILTSTFKAGYRQSGNYDLALDEIPIGEGTANKDDVELKILVGNVYRNYASYFPHLPKDISNIEFVFPELKAKVATANLSGKYDKYNGAHVYFLRTSRPTLAKRVVGFDYGEYYWRGFGVAPHLIDEFGRVIPRVLYCGDRVWVELENNGKTIQQEFDRAATIKFLRENTDVNNKEAEQLKKLFIQKGYIPKPQFVKPVKLDLAWELRQAAYNGNIENVEYILDWSQEKIDINAVSKLPNSTQKTALHNAAEQGHFYLALYLIYKGADLTPKDNNGNTPLQLAEKNHHNDIVKFITEQQHPKLGQSIQHGQPSSFGFFSSITITDKQIASTTIVKKPDDIEDHAKAQTKQKSPGQY